MDSVIHKDKEYSKKILEREPVLNDKEPKWLIVRETTRPPNKQELEMVVKGEKVDWLKEIAFKTVNPNQWQCKKCGGVIQSDKQPDVCNVCDRASNFERITKNINPDLWTLPKWVDIPVEDLGIHITKYSRFGLSFIKSFLINKGANPVFYVSRGSMVKVWPNANDPNNYSKVLRSELYDNMIINYRDLIQDLMIYFKDLFECLNTGNYR